MNDSLAIEENPVKKIGVAEKFVSDRRHHLYEQILRYEIDVKNLVPGWKQDAVGKFYIPVS